MYISAGPESVKQDCLNDLAKRLGVTRDEVIKHFPTELNDSEIEALEYYGYCWDAWFEGYDENQRFRDICKRREKGDLSFPMTYSWATSKVPWGELDGTYLGVLSDEQLTWLFSQLEARYPNLQLPELKGLRDMVSDTFIAKMKYWKENQDLSNKAKNET